jgi:hypothetical protein
VQCWVPLLWLVQQCLEVPRDFALLDKPAVAPD